MDLSGLLAPLDRQSFVEAHWGKSHCLVRGGPTKFDGMFSWIDLERVLETHRLDGSRLRMVSEGTQTPPDAYVTSLNCRGRVIPRIRSEEVMRLFHDGQTLTLNWVDETQPALRTLAEQLSGELQAQVYINAYATVGRTRGFRPHYDDHDVLILQVAGRKRWSLFGASGAYPLTAGTDDTESPPAEPEWEGVLNVGDLLYLPRGYWHSVQAIGEGSLHLTVGVYPPTGVDFLMWLFSGAPSNELFRMDLPLLRSEDAQGKHMVSLKSVFEAVWSPDSLSRFHSQYLTSLKEARRPRFDFRQPADAQEIGHLPSAQSAVGSR